MRATPSLPLILTLLAASPAIAQPAATPTAATTPPPVRATPASDEWSVRLEPRVWYVAPEGKLTMPGSPAGTPSVKLSTLDADNPEASFEGAVMIRVPHKESDTWGSPGFWKSGWDFSVGGTSFSADSRTNAPGAGFVIGPITVAGGAAVSTSVEWSTFYAEVGKWVAGSDFETGGETRIDMVAILGVRSHSQDIKVSSGGNTTEDDETFVGVIAGVRLDFKLPCNLSAQLDANLNYLPGDNGFTGYEIAPTFTWNATPNVGVQIGYRLLGATTETGSQNSSDYYKLDGSLAGLFAGVQIKF